MVGQHYRILRQHPSNGWGKLGNGGFVETSGHLKLQAFGLVNASAPHGKAGTWLLDPENISVVDGDDDGNGSLDDAGITTPDFTANADAATVSNTSIEADLNTGTSVTISTGSSGAQGGNITVVASITQSNGPGGTTLTLSAAQDIVIDPGISISSTSGKLNVVLDADNADTNASGTGVIFMNSGTSIVSNGGNIMLGGGTTPSSMPAIGGAGTVSYYGLVLDGTTLDARDGSGGGGNISLTGQDKQHR